MHKKLFSFLLIGVTIIVGGFLGAHSVFAFSGSGSGTSDDPFIITSCVQLQEMGSALSAYYKIGDSNIDCNVSPYNAGSGFLPVGTNGAEFTGSFNGNGKKITGLFINRPTTDYVGLFGAVSSSLAIKNIAVEGANITGQDNVGGVVGGLTSGIVASSYSTGSVTGGSLVGGLVGRLNPGAIVAYSYSTTTVSGNYYVGDLVGASLTAIITNSYATGSVHGTAYGIGGLVGFNNAGTVTNSYATGSVSSSGSPTIGGLAGENINGGTITNSFWDTDTSGLGTSAGDAVGETTTKMKTESTFTFATWDFINIWNIDGSTNGGYPFLNHVVSVISATTSDSNSNGQIDQLTVVYSEPVKDSNYDAVAVAGYTMPGTGTGSGTATLVYNLTEKDTPDTGAKPDLNWIGINATDLYLDDLNTENAPTKPIDGAKPVPVSATFSDEDGDGSLDLITIVWSEPISAGGFAPDWNITSASDFANLSEGVINQNNGGFASNEVGYNFTTSTVKTDVGDLTLAYTAGGGSVTDGTNIANPITFTSASTPAFTDGAVPIVTNVTSTLTDGTYTTGQVVPINVTFSEPVIVTTTPQLNLATGNPETTFVDYSSGSGTDTLTFNYTVAAGNTSDDLDYDATNAIYFVVSGSTIKDAEGNDANATLAEPGAEGSLGFNKNIVIDTAVAPATPIATPIANPVANTYTSAQSVTLSSTGSTSIRFTTDGTELSTCSSGSLYSGAISVLSTQTINAIGCDGVGNISPLGTFAYIINILEGGGRGGGHPPIIYQTVSPAKQETPVIAPTVLFSSSVENILGSGKCPADLIIIDNMQKNDRNGKYSDYNKGTVRQVMILQAHINKILASAYNQAAGPIDGIYGKLTKQGVERLQAKLNIITKPNSLLKIDGIVGQLTKDAINNSCKEIILN